ncbi:phosphotransferase [Pantoea cypripedii]|uniref:Hydroxylysine kinase n=1 Tax=Pantoea cypripedii TaxID=55209 RepID=A0A6B9G5G8_PANCY|nr:phosphotransferase [Pantoea cypripedii]QGY32961.1 serine kinase [Pantoea cypripedii]
MSNDEAVQLAAREYSVSATAQRLDTEKDDTFLLKTSEGEKFILKVANPSEDAEEIDFQTELLQYITEHDSSLPVPRTVTSVSGELHPNITDLAGQVRQVRLMTYLEGTPLDRTSSTSSEREHIGEILGRLRLACKGFSHLGDSRVLAWDVQHLKELQHLLPEIADDEQRAMLELGMKRYLTLLPRIRALRTQVLHNDFSQSNIVVDHEAPNFVTGIIDFGDAVKTAIAIDVSTALLNQLPRQAHGERGEDLFAAGKDVLKGYLRVTELTDEELELIPHLTMARVIARTLITHWRVKLFPENAPYIMRNTEQGWAQLRWFLSHSVEEVSASLKQVSALTE